MNKDQIRENPITEFISRYRKWFIAGISLQLIPIIMIILAVIGSGIYTYINDDSNWHPYKSYIEKGYNEGLEEGNNDRGILSYSLKYLETTPWYQYEKETRKLKEQALKEKDEYLAQFPEHERGIKRAEMKTEGIKLPLEKELENRFERGLDFYADYVDKKIKKEAYNGDKEYQQALKNEAWKIGYEYGYGEGWFNNKNFAEKL